MSQITVQPGDNLQALVTANPAGTVFVIRGEHHGQSLTPKDDQQFVGGPGVILDGAGADTAFAGVRGGTGAKRVRLADLEICNYMPTAQNAAVRPFGYAWDWTLDGCDIHHNANWGVQVDSGWHVIGCDIHHNGTMGLGGGGKAIVEDCSIYGNNTTGADSHWEAGGCKFVYADGLIIKNCRVYGNDGPGIWFDGHTDGATIRENVVHDNRGPGIDWEINGACLIEGNTCYGNGTDTDWADDYDLGGGGILIIDSAHVIIRNNVLLDNQGGIGLVDDNRSGRSSWPNLEYIEISGNRIRYAARKHGIAIASGRPALSSTVVFQNNQYEVDPSRQGFRIGSTNLSLAGWQAKYPTDLLYEDEPQKENGMAQFAAAVGLTVTGVKSVPVRPAKPLGIGVFRSIGWDPVPGASMYRLQRKIGTAWVPFADTEMNEMAVSERGWYRLRAVNSAGAGPWAQVLV